MFQPLRLTWSLHGFHIFPPVTLVVYILQQKQLLLFCNASQPVLVPQRWLTPHSQQQEKYLRSTIKTSHPLNLLLITDILFVLNVIYQLSTNSQIKMVKASFINIDATNSL